MSDNVLQQYRQRIQDLDAELQRCKWSPYAMDEQQYESLDAILRDLLLLLGARAGALACEVVEEYLALRDKAYIEL